MAARRRRKVGENMSKKHSAVRLSEKDWDDVADLCEQAAVLCETGFEAHTKLARKTTARWLYRLGMKAHLFAVAAGSIEANKTRTGQKASQ
jgi:hypothetical protein